MTKKQKIWLAVFLAMFLVPEILWGAVRSYFSILIPIKLLSVFNLSLINDGIDDNSIAFLITLIQFIGISAILYTVYKTRFKLRLLKIVIMLFLVLLVFLSINLLYMGFYYLSNYPQIG